MKQFVISDPDKVWTTAIRLALRDGVEDPEQVFTRLHQVRRKYLEKAKRQIQLDKDDLELAAEMEFLVRLRTKFPDRARSNGREPKKGSGEQQ